MEARYRGLEARVNSKRDLRVWRRSQIGKNRWSDDGGGKAEGLVRYGGSSRGLGGVKLVEQSLERSRRLEIEIWGKKRG